MSDNNKKSSIPWWMIVICFVCGLWPFGIILLIIRLGQESGAFSNRQGQGRGVQNAAKAAREAAARAARKVSSYGSADRQATNVNYQNESHKHDAQAKGEGAGQTEMNLRTSRLQQLKSGKLFTVIGAVMMALFGVVTLMALADNIGYLFYEPMWVLEDVLPPFILTGVGAGIFTWGRFKKGQIKRFRRYLTLIGDQKEVSISALAAAYPAKRDAACTTLENMIEAGLFGERAYLDYGRDLLVLDGPGVRPEEQKQPKQSKQKPQTAPETDIGEENALLRQIREVNDAIKHPELSRKIDRIGEITERILEFQREHPDKSAELRKFLNYYLPTTLKILNSYAELEKQGIEGENIAATMQRIEGMMDMVVEGFERQLDKLFAGDMMDIAADITVMEQMMQGDGLFDKDKPFDGDNGKGGKGGGAGAGMGGH